MGDSVITIRLTKPFAPFLAILTMPYAWIVPREAVLTYGDDFGRHPVGTGPFEFTAWNQDIDLTLQRNTRYFKFDDRGRRLPYLDTVRVTFLRDTRNEFLEFTKGRYDLLGSVDPAFAASIFTDKGTLVPPYDRYRLYRVPSHSVEYYGMLQDTTLDAARRTPLATSRRLRQALNYAIDRHRIVTYLLRGSALPATHGVLPPSMPGFSDTVHGYTYDPERARQLLAEAGYPNGKGLPTLTLQLGNSERTTSVAEAVQDMWKEIGVNVEIRTVDFPQHLSMVRAGQLALWRTSWIGDYPDPENFLALFVEDNIAPNGPNTTRVHRRDLDSLYALALGPSLSLTERSALYNRMERIILDDSPWIFLYYDVTVRLAQPSVHGLTVDGTGRLVLENVFKTASR
jgi:peptide/nickel transport system substrate-binding protein